MCGRKGNNQQEEGLVGVVLVVKIKVNVLKSRPGKQLKNKRFLFFRNPDPAESGAQIRKPRNTNPENRDPRSGNPSRIRSRPFFPGYDC